MLAKYDHDNPMALKRLVAAGAQVRIYSKDILSGAFDAAEQIYADINAQNPRFKKLYDSWEAYRREESQWFRVNELSLDSFAAGRYSRSKFANRTSFAPETTSSERNERDRN